MRWVLCLSMVFLGAGCFSWQPEWRLPAAPAAGQYVGGLQTHADALFARAVDRTALEEAIHAQQDLCRADPGNRGALALLANQQILLGAAYAGGAAEREQAYLEAMQMAAGALYLNPEFQRRVDGGEPLWEAVGALQQEDLDAMGFWVTALFYWYKDCQGGIGQLVNFRWVGRARRVMERMTELDPEWGHGLLHFTWGIYYLAIPEAVGGDRKLSEDYFRRAGASGPNWLQPRWGRGRYFHIKMGNKEKCREDLEWVLAQDVGTAGGPYAWRVYIQRDAGELLADLDRYFP